MWEKVHHALKLYREQFGEDPPSLRLYDWEIELLKKEYPIPNWEPAEPYTIEGIPVEVLELTPIMNRMDPPERPIPIHIYQHGVFALWKRACSNTTHVEKTMIATCALLLDKLKEARLGCEMEVLGYEYDILKGIYNRLRTLGCIVPKKIIPPTAEGITFKIKEEEDGR